MMSALLPLRVLGTARYLSSHQHANAISGRAWPFRKVYTYAPMRTNSMQAYQRMHTTHIERMKMESGTGERDWSSDNDPTNGTGQAASAVDAGAASVDKDEVVLDKPKSMLPREIVAELDRNIVGQADAKRAVAVALRGRWRRQQLPPNLRDEVIPKNILMIGPTGVGKTEIARRIAKLVDAPFVKVEATKFTEVGYVGRDVDTIIKDLVEVAILQTRRKFREKMKEKATHAMEQKLLDLLVGEEASEKTRQEWLDLLRKGELDDRHIEADVEVKPNIKGGQGNANFMRVLQDLSEQMGQRSFFRSRRKMTVAEYKPILEDQEMEKLVSEEQIIKYALKSAEQDGIVFIDEIDKVCRPSDRFHHSSDASAEGVQRDLLPIIEGSVVNTKHGNVDTSKILFIASGAFHSCKPSDLLAELQGRLPIRVELKGLEQADFYRILTEPETNLIKQQVALMKTENLELVWQDTAIKEVARIAYELNSTVENIGARRLHTVLEKIVEDISFNCDKQVSPVVIDEALVKQNIQALMSKTDLSKFIL